VALLALLVLAPRPAFADDKAACLAASESGQQMRNAHHLIEAREQLRSCARAECPAVVQSDCANWLSEVEKTVPTVVVSAKDASGNDVFDVTVRVDGTPLVTKLDGVAVPMNPGPHTFRFERADGSHAVRQVLVQEGQKNIAVAAILMGPTLAAPPASSAPPAAASASQSPPQGTAPGEAAATGSPWHTMGWIAGAAGLVGLGLGSAFGLVAISDKNAGQCSASGSCTNYSSISAAKSAATVSSTGFIAGGVLVAAGAALLVFTHSGGASSTDSRTARLAAVPMVGGGGLLLDGSW